MSKVDNAYHLILVVDDSKDNRELLSTFLNSLGYCVMEASNGLEAVNAARLQCPALILMDLAMPVMDGFNAMRILRGMPETNIVPVVACSAYDTVTHKGNALSVGFNEFLAKPIDFMRLNCLLDQFLKAA
jgi:CheY-like chemotaxis protein